MNGEESLAGTAMLLILIVVCLFVYPFVLVFELVFNLAKLIIRKIRRP